jgi:hypothetical protein
VFLVFINGRNRVSHSRLQLAANHYLIAANSMKEIVPDLVDDGKLRSTLVVDESASPRCLIEILGQGRLWKCGCKSRRRDWYSFLERP